MLLFNKSKSSGIDYIIAGLGNPGDKYAGTRHNMGFMALDALADMLEAGDWRTRKKGLECKAKDGLRLLLLKPQTFMNDSGQCVQETLAFYKLQSSRLIVIYDDIDLETGVLRVRPGGGAGTHNGMRSIVPLTGEGFPRVRIGIGKPPYGDLADYVLGKVPSQQQGQIERAVKAAAEAALFVAKNGAEAAMQQFNNFKG